MGGHHSKSKPTIAASGQIANDVHNAPIGHHAAGTVHDEQWCRGRHQAMHNYQQGYRGHNLHTYELDAHQMYWLPPGSTDCGESGEPFTGTHADPPVPEPPPPPPPPPEKLPPVYSVDSCKAKREQVLSYGDPDRKGGRGQRTMLTPVQMVALGRGTCNDPAYEEPILEEALVELQKYEERDSDYRRFGCDQDGHRNTKRCQIRRLTRLDQLDRAFQEDNRQIAAAAREGRDPPANPDIMLHDSAASIIEAKVIEEMKAHEDDERWHGKNKDEYILQQSEYGDGIHNANVPMSEKPGDAKYEDNVMLATEHLNKGGGLTHMDPLEKTLGNTDKCILGTAWPFKHVDLPTWMCHPDELLDFPWWFQWIVPGAAGVVVIVVLPTNAAIKLGAGAGTAVGVHYYFTGHFINKDIG